MQASHVVQDDWNARKGMAECRGVFELVWVHLRECQMQQQRRQTACATCKSKDQPYFCSKA
jgi:hypothetical protein